MTNHKIIAGNSAQMSQIASKSVNLVVTSPPYPMIEMWDDVFAAQDADIRTALDEGNGKTAFNKMHDLLDSVWSECDRVLADNGFICINIGDATRTINNSFQLYSNHTKIIQFFIQHGYSVLPDIHWRKQSNAPNKFMGSGMYPAGAYVTYEHEYILVFRKGGIRTFKGEEKSRRQKSAFFWEERNVWFSDLWEIKGTTQKIANTLTRGRSAAFPFEIPYRLVNMYSIEGDTVLDPFAGIGTTALACMAANRNSIGFDIDAEIAHLAISALDIAPSSLNKIIECRIQNHIDFINSLSEDKKDKCYVNTNYAFKVKTKQETAIKFNLISTISRDANCVICEYQ